MNGWLQPGSSGTQACKWSFPASTIPEISWTHSRRRNQRNPRSHFRVAFTRFPTKDYRQISLIFIRKITGFYRFRLFSFLVLQIPAFLIPGFTDFGFPHSRYNRFRLFSFQVLQIPAFLIPGFTDFGKFARKMILTSRAQWKKSGKFLSEGRLD